MSKKDVDKYLNKARHNQKAADFLESQGDDGFPDWVVTATFYVGLHLLYAWLISQGRPKNIFNSHGDMRRLINPDIRGSKPNGYIPVKRRVYDAYIELYDFSISARYEGFLDEKAMVEFERIERQLAKDNLDIIRQFVMEKGLNIEEQEPDLVIVKTSVVPVK
jgi:hypothetical protein